MRNSILKHSFLALLIAAAVLALGACGGGDESTTAAAETVTTASEPDLDRYCELIAELDQRSADVFNELGAGGVPTNEELAAAQLQVLDDNAELIDEAIAVVPDEIQEDFQLSLDSARERAESGDASQPPKDVADAVVRLQDFRRDNCPKPNAG
jgi:hypothetical protein